MRRWRSVAHLFLATLLLGANAPAASAEPIKAQPQKAAAPVATTTEPPSAPKNARPADWAVRYEHAVVLAKAMQPEDVVIGSAMQALDQSLVKTMRNDPDVQQIEAEHPGFTERYYAAARPELEKLLRERMPTLWRRMGEALAMRMTVAELDQSAKFYSGPVGQKMLRLGADNFDAEPLLAASLKDDDSKGKAQKEELARGATGSYFAALAAMSQADREAYSDFMASSAGSSLSRASADVSDVMMGWMNEDDPDATGAMAEVAKRVLQELDAAKVTGKSR